MNSEQVPDATLVSSYKLVVTDHQPNVRKEQYHSLHRHEQKVMQWYKK